MAVYAIGDVQGCFTALRALLDRLAFDPQHDQLWFTGDLVNRGPQSLEVLRLAKALDAIVVLGNHDLHLLGVAHGVVRPRPRDTFGAVLTAPDRDELLEWLRRRPLLHDDVGLKAMLVHAGLLPQWDRATAGVLAREVEQVLRGPDHTQLYRHMYGDQPDQWSDDLRGWERLRVIVNGFTRLRYCDQEGRMALEEKGPPGSQPAHLFPWYAIPARPAFDAKIIFGHWSALGAQKIDRVISLDSGCVWGGSLTGARLEPDTVEFYAVSCTAGGGNRRTKS